MSGFWRSVADVVTNLGTTRVIEVLIAGLALSLCLSGLYVLCRRKVADAVPLLVGLMFACSITSMAMAVGFVRRADSTDRTSQGPFNGVVFDGMALGDWEEHAAGPRHHGGKGVSQLTSPSHLHSTAPSGSVGLE